MTFSKASRMSVLAALLLLMGFAGASYGAVTFDVRPAASEVITTGMSEVLGSLNMVVVGTGNVTGTSVEGGATLGISFLSNHNASHVEIDNTTKTGIHLFTSDGFSAASAYISAVKNLQLGSFYYGQIEVHMDGDYDLVSEDEAIESGGELDYDYLRLEGVRGRIAISTAGPTAVGNDLYAKLQSIGDPDAFSFANTQDIEYRVATSYPGMTVSVTSGTSLLLCFPSSGFYGDRHPEYDSVITITEGFARAFVDMDAGSEDRVDTDSNLLGSPTNSTQVKVFLTNIPTSVASIDWPSSADDSNGYGSLVYVSGSAAYDHAGNASAVYSFESTNQTGGSDVYVETFYFSPEFELGANQTAVGMSQAQAALWPVESPIRGLGSAPGTGKTDRPRFKLVYQPDTAQNYVEVIRCNCYMLFSYVAATGAFDTGFAVANTSSDSAAFGTLGAPQQTGPLTFYFYDAALGYVASYKTANVAFGQTYVGLLSDMLAHATPHITGAFNGYVIAKAEFQYCYAVSYIADSGFAATAQGYAALIIPDPAIKGLRHHHWNMGRTPTAAADVEEFIPAGESLNN